MTHLQKYSQKQMVSSNKSTTLDQSSNPHKNNNFYQSFLFNQTRLAQSQLLQSNIFAQKNQTLKIQPHIWGQSSSTLQHSSPRYSFSKDQRFRKNKPNYFDIQQLKLQSNFSNQTCTFGKGRRTPISQDTLRNASINPSPDRYNMTFHDQEPRGKSLGKSFGIPWKNYEKTYLNFRKDPYSSHFTKQHVGAIYQVRQIPGKDKHKFTMYGRLKMFNQSLNPVHKNGFPQIKDDILRNKRGLNERKFGFGQRIDLSKAINQYPSPAQYNIKGFCSKFKVK